ncbi:MAG: hypothetical protein NWF14_08390 [Candidatus Bathyarchaeota archaeon]|nr:hypothetical protein [Candidatus Bathyarchaeota archaeon]
MLKKVITYFESKGPENTDYVLRLVKERSDSLRIDTVVLASTRGDTAEKALDTLVDKRLIIVGIDRNRFSPEIMKRAEEKGIPVIFSHETDYHYSEEMKAAFRRFSQGMKVAVEGAVIACLKGVLKEAIDVVSLAGSSRGADTAIVINATSDFTTVKIREVICMPK